MGNKEDWEELEKWEESRKQEQKEKFRLDFSEIQKNKEHKGVSADNPISQPGAILS